MKPDTKYDGSGLVAPEDVTDQALQAAFERLAERERRQAVAPREDVVYMGPRLHAYYRSIGLIDEHGNLDWNAMHRLPTPPIDTP